VRKIRGSILCVLIAVMCAWRPPVDVLAEASAHDAHEHFVAGEPGDPKKPFRVVKVTMLEDGKTMLFAPAVVNVHRGEQVRFEIFNEGSWNHEFVLGSEEANRKHAELMKKFPDMEHADPNALRLPPLSAGAILWQFTITGTFEYACLIPGHREAGMHGEVIVK
jgi:uncharacterized cupredoxin-like copper-binding protein